MEKSENDKYLLEKETLLSFSNNIAAAYYRYMNDHEIEDKPTEILEIIRKKAETMHNKELRSIFTVEELQPKRMQLELMRDILKELGEANGEKIVF